MPMRAAVLRRQESSPSDRMPGGSFKFPRPCADSSLAMPADVSAFLRERSFEDLSRELDAARTTHWEDAAGSLEIAIRCSEAAGGLGHDELRGRALALQGAVTLNRGDLQGALALATEAARHVAGNAAARCELASLKS